MVSGDLLDGDRPAHEIAPNLGPDGIPIGPGPAWQANPPPANQRFDSLAHKRELWESKGISEEVAALMGDSGTIRTNDQYISKLEEMKRELASRGKDFMKDPALGWVEYVGQRAIRARDSNDRKDRFSTATAEKYKTAMCQLLIEDPARPDSLLIDNSLLSKNVKGILKKALQAPIRNIKLDHSFDPVHIVNYLDNDGQAELISNADATSILLQLRWIVAMIVYGNRRAADLARVLPLQCKVGASKFDICYEYLKQWGEKPHVVTYERDLTLPSHRDPAALLKEILRRRAQVVSAEDNAIAPYLLLWKSSNGRDLVGKNASANTINRWVSDALSACGLPEFTYYDLLKAVATQDAELIPAGTVGMNSRWRSAVVFNNHYVKKDARLWLPIHMRDDPEELASEKSPNFV